MELSWEAYFVILGVGILNVVVAICYLGHYVKTSPLYRGYEGVGEIPIKA